MFWASVKGGLDVLLHWESWAASIVFILLLVLPMIVVGLAATKHVGLGCAGMVVLPVFQALATLMVVLTLSPIILGLSSDAAWQAPWQMLLKAPWQMLKGALFLTLVALGSAFVPIIGQSGTFTSMVVGSFAIAGVARVNLAEDLLTVG